MATIILQWTPGGGSNVSSQIAEKRIKGNSAWDSSGFTPSNPLSPTDNTTNADVTPNTIYEFIVTSYCVVGGPSTISLKEGIVFECIAPTISSTWNTIGVSYTSLPSSFNKVRFILKDVSQNILQTQDILISSSNASHTFTGLSQNTQYYIEIQFSAIINGIEVFSNDGVNHYCYCSYNQLTLTRPTAWIGDESSVYCEQQ